MTRLVNLTRLGGIAVLGALVASSCKDDAVPIIPDGGDTPAKVPIIADGGDAPAELRSDEGADESDGDDGTSSDLVGDGEASVDSGPSACANVPATDAVTLLDDFEDGDNEMVVTPNRTGFWSLSADDTPGAVRTPPGAFLPDHGGRAGSSYAAHFTASGFKAWGASLGLAVLYQKGALFCAYNASKFAGIGFYAKGPGKIRVGVPSAATVPSPANGGLLGGACEDPNVCWDQHGAFVDLTSDWVYYEFAWDDFQQFGFGTGTLGDLDPGSIAGISFSVLVGPDFQPADFWIDDLTFVKTLTVADGGNGDGDAGAGSSDDGL